MNERIKQLAEQAFMVCLKGLDEKNQQQLERFAELVHQDERSRCINIIENYQIPVGNSAAGEIACEMTYSALKDIRDQIRGRTESTLQEISDIGQEIEQEPKSWMGVSDNPYCDDVDCNDPNGRAMRWHNKLLELRKPKNELDAIDRAYFAGKEAGIAECEAIAKLREKNT
jgi:uncharacterized protein YukE